MTTKPSRSGARWSDADYAARGYGRLTLRIAAEALEQLAYIARHWECSRVAAVTRLIQERYRRISGDR